MMNKPHIPPSELEEELGLVVSRGRRRKMQRNGMAAGALAMVMLVAAIGVVRSGQRDESLRIADEGTTTTVDGVTDPTTIPTTPTTAAPGPGGNGVVTPTTVSTPPAPSTGFTEFAVAVFPVDIGSELVLLDGATGERRRTLYKHSLEMRDVELSPDGKHVYFTTESCGSGPIERVRVDGPANQKPEEITKMASSDPAVSPDGRSLAYLSYGECGDDGTPQEWGLRVRDLASGAERWVAKGKAGWGMRSPTWSPDGKQIAVAMDRWDGPDGDLPQRQEGFVAIVDPAKQQDPYAAKRLSSKRPGFGFIDPTFLPDGNLFLIETPLGGRKAAAEMLVVSRPGDTVRRVASGDPARSYRDTATDASGKHLMYLSEPGADGPRLAELRVSNNGARTRVLTGGVLSADL